MRRPGDPSSAPYSEPYSFAGGGGGGGAGAVYGDSAQYDDGATSAGFAARRGYGAGLGGGGGGGGGSGGSGHGCAAGPSGLALVGGVDGSLGVDSDDVSLFDLGSMRWHLNPMTGSADYDAASAVGKNMVAQCRHGVCACVCAWRIHEQANKLHEHDCIRLEKSDALDGPRRFSCVAIAFL